MIYIIFLPEKDDTWQQPDKLAMLDSECIRIR